MYAQGRDEAPPQYRNDVEVTRVYSEWKKTIEAASELDVLMPELTAAQKELSKFDQSLKQLKEKSAAAFEALHKKKKGVLSSLLHGVGRTSQQKKSSIAENGGMAAGGQLSSHEGHDVAFERAKEAEDTQAKSVARLNERVAVLTQRKESLETLAISSEDLWASLCSARDATPREKGNRLEEITSAKKEVEEADNAFREQSRVLADVSRVQLAASNAHRYLANVLKSCDANNLGGASSMLAEGFRDATVNMWKQNGLNQAAGEGKKAQACLNEVFRIFEPHVVTLPEDRAHDYEMLQKSGVQQMSKIYDLLYQGDSHANSVRPLVKTMLERQEAAFGVLTRLAVWIQERAPICKTEERRARAHRDAARDRLAELWLATTVPSSS